MSECISCAENISVSNPLGIGDQVSDPCGCVNGGLVLQETPLCGGQIIYTPSTEEIIPFSPTDVFTIEWTEERIAKFGTIPNVKMFIFDAGLGKYTETQPTTTLDTFPNPTSVDIVVGDYSGYFILK